MKDLEVYGFQINPYYTCMSNKIINKNHMKVVWHMDDLKVPHYKSFETTKFAKHLSII